jgi:hypothetical protein
MAVPRGVALRRPARARNRPTSEWVRLSNWKAYRGTFGKPAASARSMRNTDGLGVDIGRGAFLGGIAALTASSPLTAQNNAPDSNGMIYRARSAARPSIALRDGYRKRVFLMTKFDGRTKKAAAQQIDESLKRLQTDHVDLLRFHENIRMEDPDEFFKPEFRS